MAHQFNSKAPNSEFPDWIERLFRKSMPSSILYDATVSFFKDNCFRYAAALAYYTLLSVPPIMLIVVYVAALFVGQDTIESRFFMDIQRVFSPEFAKILHEGLMAIQTSERKDLGAIASFLMFLLSATGVFVEIQSSINAIWGVHLDPNRQGWWVWIKNRMTSMSIIISFGFLMLVSLIVSTMVQLLLQRVLPLLPESINAQFLWLPLVLNNTVFLMIATIIFAMVLKFLPDTKVPWRYALLGGLITSLLFGVGKYIFVNFLSGNPVASAYGAAGSVVAMLIWVYFSGLILFYGAEVTQSIIQHKMGQLPLDV
jgi:membrane protein